MARRRTTTAIKPGLTLAKSFNISVIIHMLPLLLLLGAMPNCIGCGQGGGGSGQEEEQKKQGNSAGNPDTREIKEKRKEIEVDVVNVPVQKGEEQLAYEAAKEKQEKCEPFFGGIGIVYNPWDGTIQKVYKYYPAWSAGLLEGDKLINVGEIRGPVGTDITVKYSRNGTTKEIKMKRGRICVEDAMKEAQPKEVAP